jgi:hypothetical protein
MSNLRRTARVQLTPANQLHPLPAFATQIFDPLIGALGATTSRRSSGTRVQRTGTVHDHVLDTDRRFTYRTSGGIQRHAAEGSMSPTASRSTGS